VLFSGFVLQVDL